MILVQVTRASREQDYSVRFENATEAALFVAQNVLRPDGFRCILYEELSGLAEFTLPDEPNAVLVLRVSNQEALANDQLFTDKALLVAARDGLHASDGYLVFASWDNDGGAKILESRPSLWRTPNAFGQVPASSASRRNEWGREDLDRY